MDYSEKADQSICEGVEADEVLPKLTDKLAPKVHSNMDSFIVSLKNDETFTPHGDLIHSVTINGEIKTSFS